MDEIMQAFGRLKARLAYEFGSEEQLQRRLSMSSTLDEILCALASSYRAWLLTAAAAAQAGGEHGAVSPETAEKAAQDREETLITVMRFFERHNAVAGGVEVHMTGPTDLRVRSRVVWPEGAAADGPRPRPGFYPDPSTESEEAPRFD